MAVLALGPRAAQAIRALHTEMRQRMGNAMLKPPTFWRELESEYDRRLKAIVREGMNDADNSQMVRVKCPTCDATGSVPRNQARWRCCCEDHHTFATMVV